MILRKHDFERCQEIQKSYSNANHRNLREKNFVIAVFPNKFFKEYFTNPWFR